MMQRAVPGTTIFPLAAGLALLLSGCELMLFSPTMPGLMPGLGRPLTGRVLDSHSGLPLGRATVLAGWGSATTDSGGHFSLYGDFSGGKSLSIARAGYVTVTYELERLAEGDTYFVDPSFSTSAQLSSRELSLTGLLTNVDGSPMTANGNVSFGAAASTPANQAKYAIKLTQGMPGTVISGVLAGGQISGGPVTPERNQSPQAFHYLSFGHRLVDIPSTVPETGWAATADLQVQDVPFSEMAVVYGGAAGFSDIRTDVSLDFGMLGSVLVARGLSSNHALRIPKVDGTKYVIEGRATDAAGRTASQVTLATNLTARADLKLLAAPKVKYPTDKLAGVGGNPVFEWEAVPEAQSYTVVVYEDTGGANLQPKWKGHTLGTQLRYPGFWDNDLNGGILYPGATYSWSVHALSTDTGFSRTAKDLPPTRPFRQRRHESVTSGMRFSR